MNSRAIVATIIGVAFSGSVLVTPLYALFRAEFGFSTITLTLIYATYVVGNLIALIFFGGISDQIGRRPVAITTIVLAAISTLLFAFAHNTVWLFAARGLSGFAVGVLSGTATAWLADLYAAKSKTRASFFAIVSNLAGIALGPLLAGLLAQYAPMPLQLPFYAYFVLLALLEVLVVVGPPETVGTPLRAVRELRLRPRVGIPHEILAPFISPAIAIFSIFALCGFYFALLPSILREALGVKNVAVGGAIVFEMALVSVAVVVVTRNWESGRAMLGALLILLPALAVLVCAEAWRNTALLLGSGALTGASLGLGYRGSLQVVNEIAPAEHRAEVLSSYFIACFVGNSVPVIGVAVVASRSSSLLGSATFAAVIAAFAVVALIAAKKTYGSRAASIRKQIERDPYAGNYRGERKKLRL